MKIIHYIVSNNKISKLKTNILKDRSITTFLNILSTLFIALANDISTQVANNDYQPFSMNTIQYITTLFEYYIKHIGGITNLTNTSFLTSTNQVYVMFLEFYLIISTTISLQQKHYYYSCETMFTILCQFFNIQQLLSNLSYKQDKKSLIRILWLILCIYTKLDKNIELCQRISKSLQQQVLGDKVIQLPYTTLSNSLLLKTTNSIHNINDIIKSCQYILNNHKNNTSKVIQEQYQQCYQSLLQIFIDDNTSWSFYSLSLKQLIISSLLKLIKQRAITTYNEFIISHAIKLLSLLYSTNQNIIQMIEILKVIFLK